jgi:hypothetical protein
MISQCCSCGKNFQIITEEVMFCSSSCEKKHDLFSASLAAPVKVSYLTPEELEKYRNRSRRTSNKKTHRVADWRWPQNRRKDGPNSLATKGYQGGIR